MILIDKDKLIERCKQAHSQYYREFITEAEEIDCVSRGLFEQIKAERDIAVSQLRELNIELGERVDLKAIPIKWLEDEIELLKKQDDWVLKTFGEYSDFSTPYEVLLKKWRNRE